MKIKSVVILMVLSFFTSNIFAQQTAIYTNDMAEFNRALSLFNNEQYLAAQTAFSEVKEETDNLQVEADAAYYIATSAVKMRQPGAEKMMEDFVERYPTSTKRNSAFIDVANFYFETGNYSGARRWYERVDESKLSRKEMDEFNFNNGYAYFKSKKYDEARDYLNRVKDSKEYGTQAKYYLGFMAYEGDDYQEAQELFEDVKGDETFNEDLSYFQADMSFKSGDFQKAIDLGKAQLDKANRQEKSELNKIIGESYFNLGQYAEAIPYLKEYNGERGKWSNTDYYQLGYAYFKQGDYENSISEFNKIIGGDNAVAQNAYYHLAEAYLKLDQKQQALNAFKNASEMDFDAKIKEDAFLNYAKLSYEIGNSYESVPQVLNNFLLAYPNSPAKQEIESLLIDSYLTSKNYKEALKMLEGKNSFESKVAYQKVAYFVGIEQYNEGDYNEAIATFDKSLGEPRDPVFTAKATFWKAESQFNVNRFQDALIGYKQFDGMSGSKGTPEKANIDYNIGYAYFKMKQYDQAASHFGKYAKTSDDKARKNDAYIRLGDSHFVNSNYWPAMEAYNEAIALSGGKDDYAAFQKAISYGFVDRNAQKIENLNTFLSTYTWSSYMDDALFELGNTYVAIDNNVEAIKTYNRLIVNMPESSYASKAMLKQGLIFYNQDQNNEALTKFKKVVADYPSTEEAIQAVKTARLIYIDMGNTDAYAQWVRGLDFVNVTDAELDETTFEAAEKQYRNNEIAAATNSLEKYLQQFPKGLYALKSNYYLADLYFRDGKKEKAISYYEYVLDKERNEYTEQALARLSQIYLEKRDYVKAIPILKRLETAAEYPQNVIFAQSNLMKSYYEQKDYAQTIAYAEKVLANKAIEANVKSDAHVMIARAAMKTGDENRAKNAYAEVQKIATGSLAAEALYYNAYFKNKTGEFAASNEVVQKLAKDYSGYKLYGGKGLVIMAKNFYALGDAYQATYILDSVIKNFSDYPEVVIEAQTELNKIKTEEAKTNSSVQVND
ncbi:MAG TPA: tetratricopeptide repeat protein [Salinimicrobium sp.]|nr:tetratricopeptide repeat protein [Salinimicrobium sp.]